MCIRLQAVAALFAALLLTSCSQGPQTTLASTKPAPETTNGAASAEPVSGKTAFWEMYKSAHAWAADMTPLSLESKTVPGAKNDAGKAAMWSATFGSLSKHEARTFSYAVAAHPPDIAKGITVGHAIPWGGPTHEALPFDSGDFKIDSDAAYKTAYTKAAAWVEKHPDKQATLTLGNASRFPAPVWYVLWGDKKLGYAVFVNAKTGAVIK
jgi:hypothetical protein